MTYRDDHDAALARAAALEEENQRLREENEQLKNPPPPEPEPAVPEPAAPAPAAPAPLPQPAWPPDWLKLTAMVAGGALLFIVLVWYGVTHDPDRAESERSDQIRARNAYQARWSALVWIEPCLRDAENSLRWALRYTPERYDPRAPDAAWVDVRTMVDRLGGRCRHHAFALISDPALRTNARRALSEWGSADDRLAAAGTPVADYYSNRDWVEDDFAGAAPLWRRLELVLDRWRSAKTWVEEVVLPELRVEIGALAAAHERRAGRDETWWRIHVGLAVWDLLAAGHAAMRDSEEGAPIDAERVRAACRDPAAKVIALGKEAPLEVRRALRDLQGYYLEPLAAGTAADPAEMLSHVQYTPGDLILSIDAEAIPGMPPEPK